MKRCMMDLETLGTKPGCTILSIGAVMFDEYTGLLGATFHVIIDRVSCIKYGLVEDLATVKWWGEQSEAARDTLYKADQEGKPLPEALSMFTDWLVDTQYFDWLEGSRSLGDDARKRIMDVVEIWGNGSDFDNAILAVAYDKVGGAPPWKFWNNRCYRTLKSLYKSAKLERVGVYHNALDDAKSQARHAIKLLRIANAMPPLVEHWLTSMWRAIKAEFKWLA